MNTLFFGLALLGALGVISAFYALAVPRLAFRRARGGAWMDGIQVSLDRAGIQVAAAQFVLRGTLLGLALGVVTSLITGTPAVFPVFFAGGYLVLWVHLEDRRNQQVNDYHHDLATAMGIVVNSWKVTPSLSQALEAVARFGPGSGSTTGAEERAAGRERSVAEDFGEILRALHSGVSLRDALQQVADRRRSPIFDGMAMAMLVAEEQGSRAGEMLERQAKITRQQVATFNDAIARQRSSRSEVRVGTLGPWGILGMVQGLTLIGAGGLDTSFFRTPVGTGVALLAAAFTLGMYAWAMRLAGQGLLLTRVPTEHGREVPA
jgi:hypothetical protein